MKRLVLLAFVVALTTTAFAQTAKETMVKMGKQQLAGYIIDIPGADVKTVDAAFRDKLEKQYNLKASSESGFHAYLNQPFAPFGSANYDLYYTVTETGKKGAKTALLSFIVSSGNLNAITSENNPETATAVKAFLNDLGSYIQEYSLQQQANTLQEKLDKLNKEQKSLEKDQDKINKQIEKLQKDSAEIDKKHKANEEEIRKIESDLKAVKNRMK